MSPIGPVGLAMTQFEEFRQWKETTLAIFGGAQIFKTRVRHNMDRIQLNIVPCHARELKAWQDFYPTLESLYFRQGRSATQVYAQD